MEDLTGFQRDLLYAVAGNDGAKGLDIKARLEAYAYGEITHSRLYPNLDTLVEKGLIRKGSLDERTNSYEITDRGVRELRDRREWEAKQLDGVTADA